MSKLYFRYGAVSSAKTLNLLAVAYNYGKQNKKTLLIKPSLDTRDGVKTMKSRAGINTDADILMDKDTILTDTQLKNINCILVDECQFLSKENIDHLRSITIDRNIPVICYGLRTNFKSNLFEGSKRLMEIADKIEEIKTTCRWCDKKAIFNKKISGTDEEVIDLGGDEKYLPVCSLHF